MAKRDSLHLPTAMSVETGVDWNGRYYIGYRKGLSMWFRDPKQLRLFLKLPTGTASRSALDSWIESLGAMDKERKGSAESPGAPASLDPSDPNYATRTVI